MPQPTARRKYAALRQDGSVAGFPTATGRVTLYSEDLHAHGQPPLARHVEPAGLGEPGLPLVMSTAKTGWYVHSAYRHVASLRKRAAAPTVEVAPDDARLRGIAEGDVVIVRTAHGAGPPAGTHRRDVAERDGDHGVRLVGGLPAPGA